MYSYIKGKLVFKAPTYAVVEAAGIGYELNIPLSTYSKLQNGEDCKLFTHFHVKEDIHQLYGFSDKDQKQVFLLLIGISGIGPSTGLAFLSSLSVGEIKEGIVSENVKLIQSVKGVGAKTAQRVIIELKDKIQKLELASGEGTVTESSAVANTEEQANKEQAVEALVALGFTRVMAERSLKSIIRKNGAGLSVEQLIKQALKAS